MSGQLSNIPHPTPPRTEEDQLAWLRLIRSHRVGAVTFHRLMREHGSAQAAMAALPEIAQDAGVRNYQPCPTGIAEDELAQARLAGARPLFYGASGYPQALIDLGDAPPLLWAQGRIDLLTHQLVAIVGARNASSLGLRMTRRLARDLGEAGFVVVSGLARGVDTEAHKASLKTGTIAIQAGGVDTTYPEENAGIADEIRENGLVLSEQPIGCQPQTRHFPIRNRIISGISRGVIIVEAANRSGSLITARDALDQGREVLAVPGHPFDARAAGCNNLIRDGAILVRDAADVIEALGQPEPAEKFINTVPMPVHAPKPPLAGQDEIHALILARLGLSPLAEDQLIRDLAMPSSAVAAEILMLELDGRVRRQPGGLLSRT